MAEKCGKCGGQGREWAESGEGWVRCGPCGGSGHRSRPESNSLLAWWLTWLVLPYFLVAVVAVYWLFVIASHPQVYLPLLHRLYPGAWFGDEPAPRASTLFALAVVVGVLAVLLVVRRRLSRRWSTSSAGPGVLRLPCFVLSFATVLVLLLGPGLVIGAGADLDGASRPADTLRAWPVALTVLTALWWSIGTTRRTVRKAVRRRFSGWVQGADGVWYPPDAQQPTSVMRPSMPPPPPSGPRVR